MEEVGDKVKEELTWEARARTGPRAAVRDELVLRPGALQHLAFTNHVNIKKEAEAVKREPEWEGDGSMCGVSVEAARAGLYADHAVKDEMVLGPEGVQLRDAAFEFHAASMVARLASDYRQEQVRSLSPRELLALRDCSVRLERCVASQLAARTTDTGAVTRTSRRTHENTRTHTPTHARTQSDKTQAACTQDSRGPLECDACGKTFQLRSSLIRHIKKHIENKPKKLPKKPKLPIRKSTQKRHLCEICEKTYHDSSALKRHKLIHTRDKPYPCDLCKKRFRLLGNLKRHTETHTGLRLHTCAICQKKFMENTQLNIHIRSHTGEKPYACDICQKTFTMSGNLSRHKLTHTGGGKTYPCDICSKQFTALGSLKTHKRSHTGEKPHF